MRAVRASALLCLSLALALTSPASLAAEAAQTPLTDRENDAPAMARPPAWIDSFKDLGFDASLTLVAQRARGSGVDERALNTRADIGLTLPGGAIGKTEGKLFAHVRAGSGAGVTGNGFATPNATAFDASARPVLMEAWYQLAIPLGDPDGDRGRFEVTVGKIDPFVFFDGNNIYLGSNDGLLVSSHGGQSFALSSVGGIPSTQGLASLAGWERLGTTRLWFTKSRWWRWS